MTVEGKLCKSEYSYNDKIINGCTMEDSEYYWCATEASLDSTDELKDWGYCTGSCVINYNDAT